MVVVYGHKSDGVTARLIAKLHHSGVARIFRELCLRGDEMVLPPDAPIEAHTEWQRLERCIPLVSVDGVFHDYASAWRRIAAMVKRARGGADAV